MKQQSGRISIVMLASILSVIVVIGIVLFSKESVASVGGRFMDALQRHDVDQLTKLSMMSNLNEEQIHKEWDHCVNVAGKYYIFAYHIEGANQATPTSGSVKVRMIKDADRPGSYDELIEIPVVKEKDDWKVDVRGLSHELFPGLPR